MIRVVVVDDEIWVCQLIKHIVDWNTLGFEIVEEAYDGTAGLDAILRHSPKLVLTDIRMSGLDGIELMEKVREQRPDTKFIVISGYNDFTYAQSALKYGALGYLLKPIDREELMDFLKSIRDSLDADIQKQCKDKEIEGRLTDSIGQLKAQYFENYFLKRESALGSLEQVNRDYGCSFRPGCFQVMLLAADEWMETDGEENWDWLESRSTDNLAESCFEYFVLNVNGFAVFVMNYPVEAKEAVRQEMRGMVYKWTGCGNLKYDITVSAGAVVPELEQMGRSYDVAVNGIQARVRYGANRLIDLGGKSFKSVGISKVFGIGQEKNLVLAMEALNCMSARMLVKDILQNIKRDDTLNPELIFTMSEEILDLFYKVMMRKGIEAEHVLGEKSVWSGKISRLGSVDRIVSLLGKVMTQAKAYCEDNGRNNSRGAVEVVKAYIAEHYKDEVSLKEAADLVCLNPKYLGELFKKETGLNFSEYLLRYRLDLAKEMLLDVRRRVGEVGERVGYQDAKYFSRLFKKHVGVTPKQYKKMFS